MTAFRNAALRSGRTENGAVTNVSTDNACVDLFFVVGSARQLSDSDLFSLFEDAVAENGKLAFQIMLWARDIRGGAGERQTFRRLLRYVASDARFDEFTARVIEATPEMGRWDDLLSVLGTDWDFNVASVIKDGLNNPDTVGLVAKWMPRQGKEAAILRHMFGLSPKAWRKALVERSDTVEQKMCANRWENIEFSKVPSVASSRYRNAFRRHQPERFSRWTDRVAKGEEKVNAAAVFPHDIVRGIRAAYGDISATEKQAVINQWNALPDFLGDKNIMPLVDVSGSMMTPISGSVMAIDISIGLGIYTAERQKGAFKDMFVTFTSSADIHLLKGDLISRFKQVARAPWGMSTNIQAAFDKILSIAINGKVPQKDMPEQLLIISDMEFDACAYGTNFDGVKEKYRRAGYELPQVVFWNVTSRSRKNMPVTMRDENTALVSGYSPAILRSVMAGKIDPVSVMLDAVDRPRYKKVFDNIPL